jgi:hypothetical protein
MTEEMKIQAIWCHGSHPNHYATLPAQLGLCPSLSHLIGKEAGDLTGKFDWQVHLI